MEESASSSLIHHQGRTVALATLIEHAVAAYGRDRLPALVAGLGQYDTWDALLPAVYGVTGWQGRWYLVGYCHLRQDFRTFRLDRMQEVNVLVESFAKEPDFDYHAYLRREQGRESSGWQVVVEFQAPLYIMQEKIPPAYGVLTTTPAGVRFECRYGDLAGLARYLVGLNVPFVIEQPAESREALRQLGTQLIQLAS